MLKRIIAIASGKGGSGKSTTALALAAIAARLKHRAVLVDLDPVGGATFGVGLDPGSIGRRGTADVFGGVPARDALVDVADGFAVLGATPALVRTEADVERTLPGLLAQLGDFDVIILDTPPGFGAFVRASAAAATEILVPIVAEPLATRTAEYTLGMLDGMGIDRDRIVGFLPTQHEARRVLFAGSARRAGGARRAPIPNGVAAAEAPLAGEAVTSYAPRSAVAVAYDALARLLKL